MAYLFYSSEINQYLWVTDVVVMLPSDVNSPRSMTTTSFICMTIQAHTVLQKLFLGIKITTQGNYVTLIIICHEHQNKLKYILRIVY